MPSESCSFSESFFILLLKVYKVVQAVLKQVFGVPGTAKTQVTNPCGYLLFACYCVPHFQRNLLIRQVYLANPFSAPNSLEGIPMQNIGGKDQHKARVPHISLEQRNVTYRRQ